jgi:cytokinin dehydrogenase
MLLDRRSAPGVLSEPALDRAAVIGLFPVSLPRTALASAAKCVERLTTLALEASGRRYLSGWLGSDAAKYLRAHFGSEYDGWLATRRRYDPTAMFRSGLLPTDGVVV